VIIQVDFIIQVRIEAKVLNSILHHIARKVSVPVLHVGEVAGKLSGSLQHILGGAQPARMGLE
jgi:hypothetical protein